jgi:hypothetical protein
MGGDKRIRARLYHRDCQFQTDGRHAAGFCPAGHQVIDQGPGISPGHKCTVPWSIRAVETKAEFEVISRDRP